MKLRWVTMFVIIGLIAAAPKEKDDAKKGDKDKLQGAWKADSLEVQGQAAGGENLGEFTVDGEKYTYKVVDMIEEGTIKLDASKKPKTIDLSITGGPDKGKTQLGIYTLEGDTFKACFAPAGSEERPTEFITKQDSDNMLFVFKKGKK